jgi:hypothetical protein
MQKAGHIQSSRGQGRTGSTRHTTATALGSNIEDQAETMEEFLGLMLKRPVKT